MAQSKRPRHSRLRPVRSTRSQRSVTRSPKPRDAAIDRTASTLRPTESTKVSWASGRAMAMANPGNPPPVPTSMRCNGTAWGGCWVSRGTKGQRLSKIWPIQKSSPSTKRDRLRRLFQCLN